MTAVLANVREILVVILQRRHMVGTVVPVVKETVTVFRQLMRMLMVSVMAMRVRMHVIFGLVVVFVAKVHGVLLVLEHARTRVPHVAAVVERIPVVLVPPIQGYCLLFYSFFNTIYSNIFLLYRSFYGKNYTLYICGRGNS